jgi:trehalose 6-phosphate synthase
MWSIDALKELIHKRLGDRRLIVVANREPYLHRFIEGRIECVPPVSGMVSALDPIVRACGGTWIAHGSGDADRRTADAYGRLRVPPDDPRYTLRRVWLTKAQEHGYYNSIANAALWPLCHKVFTRPEFDPHDWPMYRLVNELFARAVLEEAGSDSAFVFVQDYHFGLLPRLLKESNPNLIVAQFWHIPWPNREVFQVFPWKDELLTGMLGNDLLGFQLRYHCQSFLETIDRTIEAKVDYERFEVIRGGKVTVVRPFPISIDFEEHSQLAGSPAVEKEMDRWRDRLQLADGTVLGIGIDRIDYTKGIPERLRGLDRFLEKCPEYRERLVFVEIGVPNRIHVRAYQLLDEEIDRLVESINWKWSTDNWQPIVYFKRQHSEVEMMGLHRLADFCMVSSLDDGMNLVAKEFVASRSDENGVLILSQFTEAARELTTALLVNPFAWDEIAASIQHAVEMADDERRKRMQKMRAVVAEHNIFRWAGKLLSALVNFEFPETTPVEPENGLVLRRPA